VNDSAKGDRKGSATLDVLANDSGQDGDTLTGIGVTNGSKGTVIINGDGIVTYTISDGHGGTATATVSITMK
jgi:hypothetical protein